MKIDQFKAKIQRETTGISQWSVTNPFKQLLLKYAWEALLHQSNSPDIAFSDYYLFRSMQLLGVVFFKKA